LKNKTAALAQRHQFIHEVFDFCHEGSCEVKRDA
jgi:hypothetical protein